MRQAHNDYFPRSVVYKETLHKSSFGGHITTRPLKAHIPYRGDNPEVGKKTGIAVQHVARRSDGFEPFEQVLQQANGRTPPRPKGGEEFDYTGTLRRGWLWFGRWLGRIDASGKYVMFFLLFPLSNSR